MQPITYKQAKSIKNIDLPGGRVYETPVGKYPSVTTMLSATADKSYLKRWEEKIGKEEAEKIVKAAGTRGSTVHEYIDRYSEIYPDFSKGDYSQFYNSSDISSQPVAYEKIIRTFIQQLTKLKFVSVANEFAVWDDELKIAGRCDAVGYINGKFTLVDFKTSTKTKSLVSEAIKNYRIQATAYCKAHNMIFPQKVSSFIILVVTDNLTVQIIQGNPINYIPDLRYRVRRFYEHKEASKDSA
jgi:genome maintenance exonuclease 1